jgi:hypothetical protein
MAAKKKSAKPYGNKTNFVMSLPREMPAKQVVDRAKQQGMVISEAHVYKIRSTNKDKAPGKPSSPRSSGKATKAPTPRAPERSSGASEKRDFVLSFSPSTPASEILRKAKESGLGLSRRTSTPFARRPAQSPRAAQPRLSPCRVRHKDALAPTAAARSSRSSSKQPSTSVSHAPQSCSTVCVHASRARTERNRPRVRFTPARHGRASQLR